MYETIVMPEVRKKYTVVIDADGDDYGMALCSILHDIMMLRRDVYSPHSWAQVVGVEDVD